MAYLNCKNYFIASLSIVTFFATIVSASDLEIGKKLYEDGKYIEAIELLEPMAREDDAVAQLLLASAFLGLDRDENMDLAIVWLMKSFENGVPVSASILANLYANIFDPPKFNLALEWLEKAAESGVEGAEEQRKMLYLEKDVYEAERQIYHLENGLSLLALFLCLIYILITKSRHNTFTDMLGGACIALFLTNPAIYTNELLFENLVKFGLIGGQNFTIEWVLFFLILGAYSYVTFVFFKIFSALKN